MRVELLALDLLLDRQAIGLKSAGDRTIKLRIDRARVEKRGCKSVLISVSVRLAVLLRLLKQRACAWLSTDVRVWRTLFAVQAIEESLQCCGPRNAGLTAVADTQSCSAAARTLWLSAMQASADHHPHTPADTSDSSLNVATALLSSTACC